MKQLTGNSAVARGINRNSLYFMHAIPAFSKVWFLNNIKVQHHIIASHYIGKASTLIRTFLLISDVDSQCSSTRE